MDKSLEFHRKHIGRHGGANTEIIEALFVGGEWAESVASGKTFEVTNPSNGETVAACRTAGGRRCSGP